MIEIVGTALHQWDVGRYVQVTGIEVEYVHFANKGDSKAPIVGAVDGRAKIPEHLLQTGKQLCVYAVKDGITVESKIFYVKHRERPDDYVYEEEDRDFIYALITNAENATRYALSATEGANTATANANLATENANKAAVSANEAASSASLAAKNANEAADKANHTAKSLMVVGSAEGDSIHLDDAIDQYLVGLRIFGKTTQDGTPTPDAPVDLVGVVNPTVTVNDQTLLIPYTLHGITVTAGGNYTDANGQQWICDEIDFDRGVYIQRVRKVVYDGSSDETWANNGTEDNRCFTVWTSDTAVGINLSICDRFTNVVSAWHSAYATRYGIYADHQSIAAKYFRPPNESAETLENWKAWLSENPTTLVYVLATPIETHLSEEELAAYSALHTYRGDTTVSNDASAHMEIEYVMDAKKYIDSLIVASGSAARISYVSLPASKWTGSGSLYSQVVSIAGITENSQVNLAPSVEQLAIFYEKDITFVTENDGGVVTIYVIGQKPQNDYTIQADIVEVIA